MTQLVASTASVLWAKGGGGGVDPQVKGMQFTNKTMLHCFKEVKCQQGYANLILGSQYFKITTLNVHELNMLEVS